MKIECRFGGDMRALFSNVGSANPCSFYLVMTFHKSRKGGFGTEISVEQCKRLLKRKNKNYTYKEI